MPEIENRTWESSAAIFAKLLTDSAKAAVLGTARQGI